MNSHLIMFHPSIILKFKSFDPTSSNPHFLKLEQPPPINLPLFSHYHSPFKP